MKNPSQYIFAILIVLVLQNLGPRLLADAVPVDVPPSDSSIHYVGRFDFGDPAGPRFAWSGSEMAIHFQGTGMALKLAVNGGGPNYFQVVVDGAPTSVIQTTRGQVVYPLASNLPDQEHTIRVVKRTEAKLGVVQFLGFQVAQGGKALPWTATPKHRLEIIGDSISCGFGDETNSKKEPFTPATENNYLTYEALTARRFGAEYTCIAWSGYKMYPDKSMVPIWDLNVPQDPASKADLTKWVPDAIVINLSTNDFWDAVPDSRAWTGAYETFLKTLRSAYPNADIFLTNSVMLIPQRDTMVLAALSQIVSDESAAGDKKIHLVTFAREDPDTGMGAADHPNLKTHALMADVLSASLTSELGWVPEPADSSANP